MSRGKISEDFEGPKRSLLGMYLVTDINSFCLWERRLRWHGNAIRANECSLAKIGLNLEVDGKRPRGRPKQWWFDTPDEDLKASRLHDSIEPNGEIDQDERRRKKKKEEVIGNVLYPALSSGRRRIQRTMTSFLKYLDYTDDICLLSGRIKDFGQMALKFGREASRVALKINSNKIKVLSLMGHRTTPICINGQRIFEVDQFV